jgi:hypothetical protein
VKVTLDPGTIVVLALDGTLVYVEDVQPAFAAVVALPDQPPGDASKRVFTPGRVGAKKISPYSAAKHVVKVTELSERNKDFLGNYETWRGKHGVNYIHRTPEELAAMSVTKAEPAPKGKRAQRRAAERAAEAAGTPLPTKRYKQRCTQCGEQPGHPNHPDDHEFVAPDPVVTSPLHERAARKSRTPSSGGNTYTVVSVDLTMARSTERGDKFNEGNRSFRVFEALRKLPRSTGTLEEVMRAVLTDGGKPLTNPQKVVRRTLNQLATAPFGAVVSRA